MLVWIRFGKGTVGFISCAHINPLHEIEVYLISTSVVSVKITPPRLRSPVVPSIRLLLLANHRFARLRPPLQGSPPQLRDLKVPASHFTTLPLENHLFHSKKTTQSNPKTIRVPLENHHFDSKITLLRSKILLSRPQNTTPQRKNTPNPADFPGETSRLYKLTNRRLKKTMTPDRLPT